MKISPKRKDNTHRISKDRILYIYDPETGEILVSMKMAQGSNASIKFTLPANLAIYRQNVNPKNNSKANDGQPNIPPGRETFRGVRRKGQKSSDSE